MIQNRQREKAYPNAAVRATSDQMHIIELQAGNSTRVTDEATMDLATTKIPKTDHTVSGTTGQSSIKTLNSADKIRG